MESPGLSQSAAKALEILKQFSWLHNFYLAGGSALATQLTHRLSFDLDFFTNKPFDQNKINNDLQNIPSYKLDRFAQDTLLGSLEETKISFFKVPYRLISRPLSFQGIRLAAIPDIAAMKLDAIGSRGTKRDFVDLYFIVKELPLDKCLGHYRKKISSSTNNTLHIVKSLTYFVDAEASDQPLQMLKPVSWEDVKAFFEKEAVKIAKKYI